MADVLAMAGFAASLQEFLQATCIEGGFIGLVHCVAL